MRDLFSLGLVLAVGGTSSADGPVVPDHRGAASDRLNLRLVQFCGPIPPGALRTVFGGCDGLPALDADADGVTNATDCAPGDPEAWTVSSPITDFKMTNDDAGGFSWSQPVSSACGTSTLGNNLDGTARHGTACE